MECVLRDLVTENADLQSRMHRELAEAQQQLREKVTVVLHKSFYLGFAIPLFFLTCRRNR